MPVWPYWMVSLDVSCCHVIPKDFVRHVLIPQTRKLTQYFFALCGYLEPRNRWLDPPGHEESDHVLTNSLHVCGNRPSKISNPFRNSLCAEMVAFSSGPCYGESQECGTQMAHSQWGISKLSTQCRIGLIEKCCAKASSTSQLRIRTKYIKQI
jgi:hypothetical protein